MSRKVKILDWNVDIELDGDYYRPTFWEKVTNHRWDPDTFNFVRAHCNSTTVLTENGAAKGAIALRPNLIEVKTDHASAKLVQAGNHEFIFNFSKRESR